jgi:protein-S-isoprenylcysteine O-methyltransferase Ste14
MYVANRIYAPAEEAKLAHDFGAAWQGYARTVRIPWL